MHARGVRPLPAAQSRGARGGHGGPAVTEGRAEGRAAERRPTRDHSPRLRLRTVAARSARCRRSPPDAGTARGQRGDKRGDSAPGRGQLRQARARSARSARGPARRHRTPRGAAPRGRSAGLRGPTRRAAHAAEPRQARKATACHRECRRATQRPRCGHGEPQNLRRRDKPNAEASTPGNLGGPRAHPRPRGERAPGSTWRGSAGAAGTKPQSAVNTDR